MRCLKCSTPMTRVEDGQAKMQECSSCKSVWLSYPMLVRLVKGESGEFPLDPNAKLEDLAAVVVASDNKATIHCPDCHVPMRKDRFHQIVPVYFDQCPKCRGAFLDNGKLPLLRRLYKELMASTDPKIVALRQKVENLAEGIAMQKLQTQQRMEEMHRAVSYDPSYGSVGSILRLLTGK